MSQTPEELDQLIETLTGIRAGKPWETHWNNVWADAPPHLTPVQCLRSVVPFRLKPWALPPPPEGREWYRGAEFTEADLPEGYRPLLLGERACAGDEAWLDGAWRHTRVMWESSGVPLKHRTRRPLPPTEPYAVKPDPVPLGPEDIVPGSVVRNLTKHPKIVWTLVARVNADSATAGGNYLSFGDLMRNGWEIQRPGEDWKPCSKEPI